MSGTGGSPRTMTFRPFTAATALGLFVTVSSLVGLAYLLFERIPGATISWRSVVAWTILIAAVELLPVPTWSGVQVSVGYPLIMAVAFSFRPEVAALVGLLSASDPREFRG